jgi:hypothetical protein
MEIKFDYGDSGIKKCKWDYNDAYGEVRYSLGIAGVWSQAVVFALVYLGETGFFRREDVLTLNLL